MFNSIISRSTKALVFSLVALSGAISQSNLQAQSSQDLDLVALPIFHIVNSEVGLIIRELPDSTSARVGSLENGTQVRIAGEPVEGDPLVWASVNPDLDDPSSTWVQISRPQAGWVLFQSEDSNGLYEYLIPIE